MSYYSCCFRTLDTPIKTTFVIGDGRKHTKDLKSSILPQNGECSTHSYSILNKHVWGIHFLSHTHCHIILPSLEKVVLLTNLWFAVRMGIISSSLQIREWHWQNLFLITAWNRNILLLIFILPIELLWSSACMGGHVDMNSTKAGSIFFTNICILCRHQHTGGIH